MREDARAIISSDPAVACAFKDTPRPYASIATPGWQSDSAFSRPITRLGPTAKVTNSITAPRVSRLDTAANLWPPASRRRDRKGRAGAPPLPGSLHDAHNDGASRTENLSRKLARLSSVKQSSRPPIPGVLPTKTAGQAYTYTIGLKALHRIIDVLDPDPGWRRQQQHVDALLLDVTG